MFTINDILYEDNHLMVVNKHVGDLVQSDPDGTEALEDEIKAMIKVRDHKPGAVCPYRQILQTGQLGRRR